MYDVIVIGARVAGAPTAMLLARRGYRVLVLEKANFPSDALGNNLLKPPAVAALKRWGLLDEVIASGCPPVREFAYDFGDAQFSGCPPPIEGVSEGYGPRRIILDQILSSAAGAAGAEVREAFAFDELVTDGERVTGIRGHARGGGTVTEMASMVVGADGRHSMVARAVQAAVYQSRPPLACYYYTYFSDFAPNGFEAYYPPNRAIFALPTNNDQAVVVAGWPQREFQAVRADVGRHFWQTLEMAPAFAERVRAGRQEERFYGAGDLHNFFRRPHGPGWALVGDAGYHRDPLVAQGSSDAFRDVELLVEALDAGFSGRRPLEEALDQYEKRRNDDATPMYELTCQRATMGPPSPQMVALRAALRGNQPEIDRMIGVTLGTVPASEFFAPENVQRLVQTAQVTGADATLRG